MALCGFFTITLSHDIKRVGKTTSSRSSLTLVPLSPKRFAIVGLVFSQLEIDIPVPPYDTCEELMLPLIKHEPAAFGCFLVVAELHI